MDDDTIKVWHDVSDCRETGALTITLDIIICLKAIIITLCTIKGICWWKKTDTKHVFIKLMLYLSIIIVISVAVLRFFDRDVRALFALFMLSKWLVVGTFNAMVIYAERETRPEGVKKTRYCVCIPFIPFHVIYLALFAINLRPNLGFHCRESMDFPLMLIAIELVYFITIISIWLLHCKGWLISWQFNKLDDRRKLVLEIFRA